MEMYLLTLKSLHFFWQFFIINCSPRLLHTKSAQLTKTSFASVFRLCHPCHIQFHSPQQSILVNYRHFFWHSIFANGHKGLGRNAGWCWQGCVNATLLRHSFFCQLIPFFLLSSIHRVFAHVSHFLSLRNLKGRGRNRTGKPARIDVPPHGNRQMKEILPKGEKGGRRELIAFGHYHSFGQLVGCQSAGQPDSFTARSIFGHIQWWGFITTTNHLIFPPLFECNHSIFIIYPTYTWHVTKGCHRPQGQCAFFSLTL